MIAIHIHYKSYISAYFLGSIYRVTWLSPLCGEWAGLLYMYRYPMMDGPTPFVRRLINVLDTSERSAGWSSFDAGASKMQVTDCRRKRPTVFSFPRGQRRDDDAEMK